MKLFKGLVLVALTTVVVIMMGTGSVQADRTQTVKGSTFTLVKGKDGNATIKNSSKTKREYSINMTDMTNGKQRRINVIMQRGVNWKLFGKGGIFGGKTPKHYRVAMRNVTGAQQRWEDNHTPSKGDKRTEKMLQR